jgi:hypothetical protein
LLVFQVGEVLAEVGQFVRGDDLAEGREHDGVLAGLVRLVHPVERLHRRSDPRPPARVRYLGGGGRAEQELGDHAPPGVLDQQRTHRGGELVSPDQPGKT